MDYFFISNIPYHLKINGNYLGKATKNLKVLSIFDDISFLEFLPINDKYFPTYADKTNLGGIKKFPLFSGEIILPTFQKKPPTAFKILCQKQFLVNGLSYLLSVVLDGAVKFYVDGNIAILDSLPFIPTDCQVYTHGSFVFFTFTANKTAIIGYDFSFSTPKIIFRDLVDEFEISSPLKTKKHYDFINPITILEEWDLSSPLTLISRKTNLVKPLNEIPNKLIPLSFMETVSVMGDLSIYLTPELNERANDLYQFIKKPVYLFYPPESFSEVVSITEKEIFIYKFEFNGNRICNLIEK